MPDGGAEPRSHAQATLTSMAHEFFTSDTTRGLLEAAEAKSPAWKRQRRGSIVRVTRREFDPDEDPHPACDPGEQGHLAGVHGVAQGARSRDFPSFEPHIQELVEIQARRPDTWATRTPVDALLGSSRPARPRPRSSRSSRPQSRSRPAREGDCAQRRLTTAFSGNHRCSRTVGLHAALAARHWLRLQARTPGQGAPCSPRSSATRMCV